MVLRVTLVMAAVIFSERESPAEDALVADVMQRKSDAIPARLRPTTPLDLQPAGVNLELTAAP
jgi:hypothetical protein